MEIISYLDLFLGALLNVVFSLHIIRKIFKLKTIKNKQKKIIYILVLTICVALINLFNKNMFKGLMVIPLFALCVHKMFDIKVSKSLHCAIIASFYLLLGEILVALICSVLNITYVFAEANVLGKTTGNIMVIIMTFPFIYIKFMSKIFRKIYYLKLNNKMISIIFILFLLIGSAFVFKSSINIDNIIPTIMNFIIFIFFIIILYISYLESKKSIKISNEYNSLFAYLDKYEKDLVEKRKMIHDFKNQLIIINSYAEDNIKLKEYLKGIIEEHKNIKETKIIKNIDKLPTGLKGLIYYKLSQIDNKINVVLNVKSKFIGFENLNPKDNKNILKIIGILIDNSIESSIETEEKYLSIEISMNDGLFKMEIVNSSFSNLEKSKIMETGFTTKGKNRGYGLSLVKDIIRIDDRYKLELDSLENEFKTYFEMKIK